jgi:hypothetical protein
LEQFLEQLLSDYLLHIANLILLIAFAVRDVLFLRILFVIGSIFALGFYFQQVPPLWSAVGWTALYIGIHAYWISRILLERRPVQLSADEEALYRLSFSSIDKRKFALLANLGEWRNGQPGQRIFKKGEMITEIIVPISGKINASLDGEELASLGPGQCVGTGVMVMEGTAPCDAFFDQHARYIAWPVFAVRDILAKDPELRVQIQAIVNKDLATKLDQIIKFRIVEHGST